MSDLGWEQVRAWRVRRHGLAERAPAGAMREPFEPSVRNVPTPSEGPECASRTIGSIPAFWRASAAVAPGALGPPALAPGLLGDHEPGRIK